RFVRALRLARLGSVSEQSAVRHAQGLRRALGTREEVMAETADALVFFGATGDLAYKKIFPALYAMAKRNKLDFRVIGQGRKPYSREQLIERARSAVADTPDFDARAFERLAQKLDYVAGDYTEPPTFERLRTALHGARLPVHYLAIPPSAFPAVVAQLREARCATPGRVIIEKPF